MDPQGSSEAPRDEGRGILLPDVGIREGTWAWGGLVPVLAFGFEPLRRQDHFFFGGGGALEKQ